MAEVFPDIIFGLPDPDINGTIASCIPFSLDISHLEIGQRIELDVNIVSDGSIPEHYIHRDCRIQVILPVQDLPFVEHELPDWLPLFHTNDVLIERKTWNEGFEAKVVLRKDGDLTKKIQLYFMLVLNNNNLKMGDFRLKITSNQIERNRYRSPVFTQFIDFDLENTGHYPGDDETLMDIFSENGGFKIGETGSIFHPKQIHSSHSITSFLSGKVAESTPINITYVGPDTCENLHSTLRAVELLSKQGLIVGKFSIIHKSWDERSMDKIKILSPEYFSNAKLNFDVELMPVESIRDVDSDLILTTYVTSWAYSSKVRGSATEQYLRDIIKRVKDQKSLIISVDPFDVNRVTRSFNSLVHHGKPSDVFELAGLVLQKSAPGGYGDTILEQEREICWVTSYKTKETKDIVLANTDPMPNDISKLSGEVFPAGRLALIERLIKPRLLFTDCQSYLDKGEQDEPEPWKGCEITNFKTIVERNENFSFIVGGPGDGKSVFLQQLIWENRYLEDEISIPLTARDLAQKKYLRSLSMRSGDEQLSLFFEILENECKNKYPGVNWQGKISKWVSNGLALNLYVDALDEVRDLNARSKLLSILLSVATYLDKSCVKISMRENILNDSIKSTLENDAMSVDEISIYRLEWNESRIIDNFIPSLLHGWNLNIDSESSKELETFLEKSKKALTGKEKENRMFLKNPLRAVWLVYFIYDQSVDLQNMNLSQFETEILRLSVKNRFESRRLDGIEIPENNLQELLDIVAAVAILDYEWEGRDVEFNQVNRKRLINQVLSSPIISEYLTSESDEDLELFFFEDMSLLYVTGDDNLAWIHENLREHAIARGLIKYNMTGTICQELINNWGYKPPTLYQILFNYKHYCSVELSDAVMRIIPTQLLLHNAFTWLQNWKNLEQDGHELINLETPNSDDFNSITSVLESCNILAKGLMELVDEQNNDKNKILTEVNQLKRQRESLFSKQDKLIADRNRYNLQVKELVMERKGLSENIRDIKKEMNSASPSELENLTQKYDEATRLHQEVHNSVQNLAEKSESAHLSAQNLKVQISNLREESESKFTHHTNMKSTTTATYQTFSMLKYRLSRELFERKRIKSQDNRSLIAIDDSDNETKFESEVREMITDFFTNEDIELNLGFSDRIFDDILMNFNEHGVRVVIYSVNASALIGKKGSRINQLSKLLEQEFSIKIRLSLKSSNVSKDFLTSRLDEIIPQMLEEESGDYTFDITKYQFETFIDKNSEEFPNRFLTLTTSDELALKASGLLDKIMSDIKSVIGRPFIVNTKGVDLNSAEVKSFIRKHLAKSPQKYLEQDIFIKPLWETKGRQIIMPTSNVSAVQGFIYSLTEELVKEFGGRFNIKLELDSDVIKGLDVDSIREYSQSVVNEHASNRDGEVYELQKIEIESLNGIEGRKVLAYGKPVMSLIGLGGSIAKTIIASLEKKYGPPIRFHSLPISPDKDELTSQIKKFIDEIPHKPTDFKIHSIRLTNNYNNSSKMYEENRKIILDTTHNRIVMGKKGKKRQELNFLLTNTFDGTFTIHFKRVDAANLDSQTVQKYLRKYITENLEIWGVEPEFSIHEIEIKAYGMVSGRSIRIHCTRPRALIGTEGSISDDIMNSLNDNFGPPFKLQFRGDAEDIPLTFIQNSVTEILEQMSLKSLETKFDSLDGAANREVFIRFDSEITAEEIIKIKEELISSYGEPIKLKLGRPEENNEETDSESI